MIVLNKIKTRNEGEDLILSSLLEIDENNFELAVRIKGVEWHKYAVTDRLDAFCGECYHMQCVMDMILNAKIKFRENSYII